MSYLHHHPRRHLAFMGVFTFVYDILLCYDKIIYTVCVSQNTTIFRQIFCLKTCFDLYRGHFLAHTIPQSNIKRSNVQIVVLIAISQNTDAIEYSIISVFCVLSWGTKLILFTEHLSNVLDSVEHPTNLFLCHRLI